MAEAFDGHSCWDARVGGHAFVGPLPLSQPSGGLLYEKSWERGWHEHLRAWADGPTAVTSISRSMADLQREHYGRESATVNAYAIKDMIVVVVRLNHLTPFEKSMVDGGEPERVLDLRAEFARVMAGRYRHTVEQVTGRTVIALLSQAHVDPDIIVEAFFLDRRVGSKVTEGLAEVIDLPVSSSIISL